MDMISREKRIKESNRILDEIFEFERKKYNIPVSITISINGYLELKNINSDLIIYDEEQNIGIGRILFLKFEIEKKAIIIINHPDFIKLIRDNPRQKTFSLKIQKLKKETFAFISKITDGHILTNSILDEGGLGPFDKMPLFGVNFPQLYNVNFAHNPVSSFFKKPFSESEGEESENESLYNFNNFVKDKGEIYKYFNEYPNNKKEDYSYIDNIYLCKKEDYSYIDKINIYTEKKIRKRP